ncbi:MAG TPA: NAD(P)H-hydrate epimerase, partial [Lachnospiraceae bacterium]|nr:NAD(P)H-hydrate epimerase [Lachnospiraceae bacterium]
MYHIVTSEEMKKMEQKTMEGFGLSSLVLMERAALSVWDCIDEYGIPAEQTLIVCGTGNNGGDGLAIGRILYENGYDPIIVMIGNREQCTESVRTQLKTLESYGISVYDTIPQGAYTTVIDALFGIGLNRNIEG